MLGRHGGPCTQMCTHAPQSEKGTSVHMHRASHPVPCCPGLVPVSLELTPGKHAGKSQLIQGGPLTADRHLTLQHVSLPKAPPAPPPPAHQERNSPPSAGGEWLSSTSCAGPPGPWKHPLKRQQPKEGVAPGVLGIREGSGDSVEELETCSSERTWETGAEPERP